MMASSPWTAWLGIVDDRELIQSAAGDVVLGFATHLVRTHGLEIAAPGAP